MKQYKHSEYCSYVLHHLACDCGADRRTWKEWLAKGLHVKKGEHAVETTTTGQALFTHSQVTSNESTIQRGRWWLDDSVNCHW